MRLKTRIHLVWLVAVLILILPLARGQAQFFDKGPLDYDKLFKENLFKNGKYLNLSGKKIGDEGIKILVHHEVMKKVAKVDLRYNKLSAEGARILAESPQYPKLKVLILRHNFFSDNGAVAFAQTKSFPNLVELQLGWNEIRDQGALALGQSSSFPKLRKLDLRGNFLAGATKKSLKEKLAHLKSLRLY